MPKTRYAKDGRPIVTIDESRWRSGGDDDMHYLPGESTGEGPTELLNGEGTMCCLGFGAMQLGNLEESDILDRGDPASLERKIPRLTVPAKDVIGRRVYKNSSFSGQAIQINDDNKLTLKKRKSKLKNLFSKFGIVLRFKGKPIFRKESDY